MALSRERALDAAFVGAVVLLVALIAFRVDGLRPISANRGGFEVGDRLPTGVLPSDEQFERALLLVLHTDCIYCTQSMQSFRAIAARRQTDGGWRLFVLARQDSGLLREYLREHRLSVDRIISVSPDQIRRAGFPTTIAVDARGAITGVWRGRVSLRAEASILEHVSRR